ncbi:MAG: hypothetical protein MUF45_05145 [Spirosomaceae bacterium]|jgi:hypothetical protein|nr:hypothetical protein [Spirosomataceae bacterium]
METSKSSIQTKQFVPQNLDANHFDTIVRTHLIDNQPIIKQLNLLDSQSPNFALLLNQARISNYPQIDIREIQNIRLAMTNNLHLHL